VPRLRLPWEDDPFLDAVKSIKGAADHKDPTTFSPERQGAPEGARTEAPTPDSSTPEQASEQEAESTVTVDDPPKRPQRERKKPSRFRDYKANAEAVQRTQSQKFRYDMLNSQFLSGLRWDNTITMIKSPEFARLWSLLAEGEKDPVSDTFESFHPLILAAKMNSEQDNPSWEEAMNGPHKHGYWKAAEKEVKTLQEMGVWEVINREE
jgi:hypothetical protein